MIRPCLTADLLEDKEIEMIIVLTPVSSHASLIKEALLAGKHVYTEKTIAVTSKEAKELLSLANEKNLYIGSAPDTFLGAGVQTAKKSDRQWHAGRSTFIFSCDYPEQ